MTELKFSENSFWKIIKIFTFRFNLEKYCSGIFQNFLFQSEIIKKKQKNVNFQK